MGLDRTDVVDSRDGQEMIKICGFFGFAMVPKKHQQNKI